MKKKPQKPPAKITFTMRLDPEIFEKLRARAEQGRRPIIEQIRMELEKGLGMECQWPTPKKGCDVK